MDLTPNSKGSRPSEIMRAQQEIIRQQEAVIEVLKGALAAAGVTDAPTPGPHLAGLTRQEAALVGVLFARYPATVGRAEIIEHLPGHDHAHDRQLQLVDVVANKVRKKLGQAAIEAERGVGFRLGATFRNTLPTQPTRLTQ